LTTCAKIGNNFLDFLRSVPKLGSGFRHKMGDEGLDLSGGFIIKKTSRVWRTRNALRVLQNVLQRGSGLPSRETTHGRHARLR
jgi:hypothetical protein